MPPGYACDFTHGCFRADGMCFELASVVRARCFSFSASLRADILEGEGLGNVHTQNKGSKRRRNVDNDRTLEENPVSQ